MRPYHQLRSKARRAAALTLRICRRVPRCASKLAEQAINSSSSSSLNIAEGLGRTGKSRLYHLEVAYGSAEEAGDTLEILRDGGVFAGAEVDPILALLDECRAMTWRMMHPRR